MGSSTWKDLKAIALLGFRPFATFKGFEWSRSPVTLFSVAPVSVTT